MIESVVNTPVTLTANNSTVSFPIDDLRTRNANCPCGFLQHTQASPLYKIIKGGIYEISLSATVTSATAGIIALGLYQDGILIPATVSAETISTAGNLANVSFKKKIRVCCGANTTLTIASVPSVNAGATGTTPTATQIPVITNAILNISKSA